MSGPDGASAVFLASCGGNKPIERPKLTPEQIETKFASGVVLIQNNYYYSISFNGGKPMFFTGVDEDGDPKDMTFDESDITPETIYGTGFLISNDGMIATNSHVASPQVDVSSARSYIVGAYRELGNTFAKEINEMNEKLGILRIGIIASEDYEERSEMQQKYNEISEQRDGLQEVVNTINSMGSLDYEVTIHRNIGIAYNNTHVTNSSDFQECVELVDDAANDLAIIQIKSKTVPEGKHIFKLPKEKTGSRPDDDNGNNDNADGKDVQKTRARKPARNFI